MRGDSMGKRTMRGMLAALALAAAMTVAACGEKKEETPASSGSDGAAEDTATAAEEPTESAATSAEETAAASEPAAECGTVTINENAWAGSTANVYVAKYVLENELGFLFDVNKIAEIPFF